MDRCIIGLYYPDSDDGLDPEPQPGVVLAELPGGLVDVLLFLTLYRVTTRISADAEAGAFVPNPRS